MLCPTTASLIIAKDFRSQVIAASFDKLHELWSYTSGAQPAHDMAIFEPRLLECKQILQYDNVAFHPLDFRDANQLA